MAQGLRPCGKHYIVRSTGVDPMLKCEQCALQNEFLKAKEPLPEIYEDDILAQYIWKGVNYTNKIWNDLNFLDENHLLKKVRVYLIIFRYSVPNIHYNTFLSHTTSFMSFI